MLPTMVPSGVAMEWLLTSRRISVDEAERWGLVTRVAPGDKLMSVAMALAEDIASSAPLSIRRM
jgi:crotonobetainyl-CoA hydratase